MQNQPSSKIIRWFLLTIPAAIVIGTLLHFTYDWLSNPSFLALIMPTNESVFEHLKMAFWPMLILNLIGIILYKPDFQKVLPALFAGIFLSLCVIFFGYYGFASGFGIEALWLDIALFIIAIVLGQKLIIHLYSFGKPRLICAVTSCLFILILLVTLSYYSYHPTTLPLFQVK